MLLYTIVLGFGFPAYHWSCSTTWFKVSSGGFNNREPAHNLQQPPHTAEPATVHSKRGQPNPLFGHRANGPEALEPSTLKAEQPERPESLQEPDAAGLRFSGHVPDYYQGELRV